MEKKSTLLLALLFTAVVSAAAFAFIALGKDRFYGNPMCRDKTAAVQHGPRLKWRTIFRNPIIGCWLGDDPKLARMLPHEPTPWALAGSFVEPGKQELLLFWDDKGMSRVRQSLLLSADGSTRPVGLPGLGLSMASTFDHDQDGIDSILPNSRFRNAILNLHEFYGTPEHQRRLTDLFREEPATVPLFSVEGNELQSLHFPAGSTFPQSYIISSDFDRDGDQDILLTADENGFVALDADGNESWAFESFKAEGDRTSGYMPLIGDFDGNGQSELVTHGVSFIYIHSPTSEPQVIAKPAYLACFSAVADLDGDGCDDLIASQGWFSPKTSKFTSFNPPGFTISEAIAIDLDSDGKSEVVHVESLDAAIQINNADGSLRYQESFGNFLLSKFVISSGSQDHLVLQLSDRILIYP